LLHLTDRPMHHSTNQLIGPIHQSTNHPITVS
jgi:hypothetical protein